MTKKRRQKCKYLLVANILRQESAPVKYPFASVLQLLEIILYIISLNIKEAEGDSYLEDVIIIRTFKNFL